MKQKNSRGSRRLKPEDFVKAADASKFQVPYQKIETARHEYMRLKAAKGELAARRDLLAILQPTGAGRIGDLSEAACEPVIVALRESLVTHLATIAPVIPLPKNCKSPPPKDWPNLATQDPKVLKRWARERPGANWGWSPNAIDVDTKDPKPGKQRGTDTWAELVAKNGEPDTYKVETPSGGSHYLIADKIPNTQGALGDGIDTKSRGGYVVAPGSYVVANDKDIRATGFYKATAKPVISVPWIVERIGAGRDATGERGLGPVVELDTDDAISRATDMLISYATSEREVGRNGKQLNGPAIQGDGGDQWTVQVAMEVGDLGI